MILFNEIAERLGFNKPTMKRRVAVSRAGTSASGDTVLSVWVADPAIMAQAEAEGYGRAREIGVAHWSFIVSGLYDADDVIAWLRSQEHAQEPPTEVGSDG